MEWEGSGKAGWEYPSTWAGGWHPMGGRPPLSLTNHWWALLASSFLLSRKKGMAWQAQEGSRCSAWGSYTGIEGLLLVPGLGWWVAGRTRGAPPRHRYTVPPSPGGQVYGGRCSRLGRRFWSPNWENLGMGIPTWGSGSAWWEYVLSPYHGTTSRMFTTTSREWSPSPSRVKVVMLCSEFMAGGVHSYGWSVVSAGMGAAGIR